jgi:hypothetical protein
MYVLVFWNARPCSLVYADDNIRHHHVSPGITALYLPGDITSCLNIDRWIRRSILTNVWKNAANLTYRIPRTVQLSGERNSVSCNHALTADSIKFNVLTVYHGDVVT